MIFTLFQATFREVKFSLQEWYYLYANLSFRESDLALRKYYLLKNPYRVAKEFFRKRKGVPLYSYGETPLLTAFYLFKAGGVTAGDCLVDLGAGAGRLSLFFTYFFPARCIALEFNPAFCARLRKIKEIYSVKALEVFELDFLKEPLPDGTIYYLCQLFMSEEEINGLAHKIAEKGAGVKLISVGVEITHERFSLYQKVNGTFLWGNSTVYFYAVGGSKERSNFKL